MSNTSSAQGASSSEDGGQPAGAAVEAGAGTGVETGAGTETGVGAMVEVATGEDDGAGPVNKKRKRGEDVGKTGETTAGEAVSASPASTTPNLRVDGFMSHRVDTMAMYMCGETIAQRFADAGITKVVTVETAGIVTGFVVATCLNIDLVYARKKLLRGPLPASIITKPYRRKGAALPGKLYLSSEYFDASDVVLIVDSFLATGHTILTLAEMVKETGATVGGVACMIEKAWKAGRQSLAAAGISPVESLVVIETMGFDTESIVFASDARDTVAGELLVENIVKMADVTPGYDA
ncbi:xanthine phosphoribosyltransferase [Thecamonas trahens ATCC 50062]|uniref:Xanthine phosphoribosyltransferase n=1 Tax=Thecamonas trahens ATCC 50062 TaxID=461836 RepID=A0A0L0DWG2_THETB|nr:xanthine phosphoribosyltransferase [Thecamonas trahens ATCC 50062]KNC56421.1 xanthine phosphoribosyltransferase [Thecamonas trahens ATCC 50062]|eukprot:XP_013760933.1 xanthine phosphoribosyltransferase [Thecamonas trahens ATCC 50062]